MQQFDTVDENENIPLYKVWPANNVFIFKGKFITGKMNVDTSIGITIAIHIGIFLYCIFIAPFVWQTYSKHLIYLQGVLLLISSIFYYFTMFTDPGYVPKKVVFENTHYKQVPFPFNGKQDSIVNLNESIGYLDTSNQEKKKIVSSQDAAKIQIVLDQSCYCATCQIYKPPRTSHCEKCNNCVELFDHHCTTLNVCIGRRNFKFFIYLLIFASILMISVVLAILGFIYEKKWHKNFHFDTTKNKIVTIIACLTLTCAISNLLGYFLGMLGNNIISIILRKPMNERDLRIKHQKNLILPYYKFFKHEPSLFNGEELLTQTQAQNIKTFYNNQQF